MLNQILLWNTSDSKRNVYFLWGELRWMLFEMISMKCRVQLSATHNSNSNKFALKKQCSLWTQILMMNYHTNCAPKYSRITHLWLSLINHLYGSAWWFSTWLGKHREPSRRDSIYEYRYVAFTRHSLILCSRLCHEYKNFKVSQLPKILYVPNWNAKETTLC